MQENCLFGSEGGAKLSFVPTPIQFRPRWRSNSLQINRFYHQFLGSLAGSDLRVGRSKESNQSFFAPFAITRYFKAQSAEMTALTCQPVIRANLRSDS